jgi:exportin-7
VFGGGAGAERDDAQKQILQLQSSTEHINTCKGIFENSTNAYALVVAANSLEVLMTKFWNNLSAEQKLETRNYIFNFMANHTDAENYVIGALSKLLCRVTKLGWFDGTISGELREIVTDAKSFLAMSTNHHLVALKLLQSLVDEMNTPTTGKTLTYHRKTAVSFRDLALFPAFMTAIDTLKQIQSGNINVNGNADLTQKLTNLAMLLTVTCLSFDFIGTNPEESQEDVGTVQVPSSWQPIVQDTAIMELFFSIYSTSVLPASKLALQALVLLSSTRRSLFVNEKQRTDFLECLMSGIEIIMRTRGGLQEPENYHEFCRLLGRLKTCYQLSELVKIANFQSWLELAGNFTIMSFQSWQHSMNSIHYLLALWGRMVAALPYLRSQDSTGQADMLRNCVQQIVEAYTQTMLDSVDVVVQSDGMVDDPLDDEGSLKEAMDRFPVIARVSYVFCHTIVLPSFLPSFLPFFCLFVCFFALSVSLISICCCLLAFSDTA